MFKDDIKPMDKASEAILALRPVTFRYNNRDRAWCKRHHWSCSGGSLRFRFTSILGFGARAPALFALIDLDGTGLNQRGQCLCGSLASAFSHRGPVVADTTMQ